MSAFVLTPTESNIETALRSFIQTVVQFNGDSTPIEVVKGQENRVAEPTGADFVIYSAVRRSRIDTNIDSYPTNSTESFLQPTEVTYQMDVHGPNAANNTQIITTLFRSEFGVNAFQASGFDVTPLYADEPRQIPFINAESQWETRWVIEATLQVNEVVSGVPQQQANTVGPVNLFDVP